MERQHKLLLGLGVLTLMIVNVLFGSLAFPTAPVAAGFTPTPRPTEVPTKVPTDVPTEAPTDTPDGGETPNLWVSKEADTEIVAPGDTFTYRIVVKNEGPGTATGVMLEDDVPGELEIVDVGVTQGTITVTGNKVTVDVGTLGPGFYAVLTIKVKVKLNVPAGTEIVNTVVAWSDQTSRIISTVTVKVPGWGFLPESGGALEPGTMLWTLGGMTLLLIGLIFYMRVGRRTENL